MAFSRFSFVAATSRMSNGYSLVSPSGLYRFSCNALSSITCVRYERFPISSRNSVPPSAVRNSPALSLSAPVNAPFRCPKNSDAASSSGTVPQSTGTYGLFHLWLRSCISCATCSFPVPDAPRSNTEMSAHAISSICLYIS